VTLPATSPLSEGARQDERDLWDRVIAGQWPREAGIALGIPRKRVEYLCEKWTSKRIYDYGVSCDLGWPIVEVPVGG
jgi:hypothetical protein